MSVTIEQMKVVLQAEIGPYTRGIASAQAQTNRQIAAMETRFAAWSRNIKTSASSAALSISSAFGGIGAALGVSAVVEYANSWTRVTRGLEGSEQAFGVTLKSAGELNKLANDARVDLDAYSKLYTRTSAAIRDYGFEAETAEKVTSTLAKALKLGGASASEQTSVLLQFSQALQKGKLDGDEFRTVMENAGVVQELLAKRLGVTKGAIIKMAADGKLQIKDLVGAMVDGGDQVDRIFRQMPQTVDEAFIVLRNNLIEFIGTADKATGATKAISAGIVGISRNLDVLAVAAAAILSSLTFRMTAFAAASFAAGGPLGLLAAAIGGLAAAYGLFGDKVALSEDGVVTLKGAVQGFFDVINRTGEIEAYNAKISYLEEAAKKSASAQREMNDAIRDRDELLKNTPQGRADAAVKKSQEDIKALGEFIDSATASLAKFFGLEPETNILAGLATQAERIRDALADAGKNPSFIDKIAERTRQLDAQRGIEERDFGKGLADFRAGKKPDGKKEAGSADPNAKKTDFEREAAQIRKRTAALQAELETINQSVFAQERAKAAAELRAALDETVRKRGTAATKEEIAAIDVLAAKYADAQVHVAMLQAIKSKTDGMDALRDEVALLGLYGAELTEARIKQELLNEARKLGRELLPWEEAKIEATARGTAALEQYRNAAQEVQDASKEMLSSFVSDMRQGVSATEALGNALGKLADRLVNAGLDQLITSLVGGAGASLFGGAGSGGWSTTVTPFAKGGIARNGRAVSLPTFARGGVSKSAAIFGEAGPEAAIPLPDGRSVPVTLSMPDMPKAAAPSSGGGAPVITLTLAPVFQGGGGDTSAVDKFKAEVPALITKTVNEIFDRSPRFRKLKV